ncbi:MAG: amino acid permease [Anaerolineales bacterium]|jgi:amino acid transporter|nr:amino acid permease [Anaerolineales bacterium]
MKTAKKLSLLTLIMLIFVPTFGFRNVTTNAVALGPAAIPSWLVVSIFFFLPLSAIIAELASANQGKGGGIYSWVECSLGAKWAFISTWSYFVANLFYLQYVFARLPVMVSWAIFGENRFTDANANWLPYMGMILCVLLTLIAVRGVRSFSRLSDVGGPLTIVLVVLFVVFAIVGWLLGEPSATEFTARNVMPDFDVTYFATFAWLLLAVAGAEVAGTYITDVDKPNRNFPRGVIIATLFVAAAYIIGSLAVSLIASLEALTEAGLANAEYVVYQILAENFGLNGAIMVRLFAAVTFVASVGAFVVWMESPIRAMFADVPEGTFPRFLTSKDKNGTLKNALWTQALVLLVLIAIPLFGLGGVEAFFELVTNMTALSLVIPYILLVVAYIVFRHKKMEAPFTMLKADQVAYIAAGITLVLSVAAFFGAGLDYVIGAESTSEAIGAVLQTYGGPIILIVVGYGWTLLTQRQYLAAGGK